MLRPYLLLTGFLLCAQGAVAQFMTREDSLNAGLSPTSRNVILSAYGEAKYAYHADNGTARANLTRSVLFVGYRFNPRITFFSELELEGAKVDGNGGEISLEQAVLKFDINRNHYLLAGLFIPRIGIINENHLPTTFNGNDRHEVETRILPSTWREIGVGYYGMSDRIPGLNWSFGLMNGLDASGIRGNSGLRDARFEGRNATGSNLATNASLLYYYRNFRFQLSGYYGGTVGLPARSADSLGLDSGPFGTPVALGEFNVQYRRNGWVLKGLATTVAMPDAGKLNTAYAGNVAKSMYGYFVEAGYNLLEHQKEKNRLRQLIVFGRYEGLDLMASVPTNGIRDEQYRQQYLITGLSYQPTGGVVIKFDWKHVTTGKPDPTLNFNPSPTAPGIERVNDFLQLGLAYSF
jgi:hypothetical protein